MIILGTVNKLLLNSAQNFSPRVAHKNKAHCGGFNGFLCGPIRGKRQAGLK